MPAPPGFVNSLASQTGLSPQVVAAWVQAEGGPAGNPLNIGPGRNYGTPAAAAAAAAALVNSSHYYTGIRQAIQGGNPGMEIAAIKSSPWDAGHYSNGVLDRTFAATTGGRVPATASFGAAGTALPAAPVPGMDARRAFVLNTLNQIMGLDGNQFHAAIPSQLPSAPQTPFAGSVTAPRGVSLAAGANRAGVGISPIVMDFVGQIAGVYGKPLTIGTGTNHNEYVQGSNRVSEHWGGYAADIPSSGAALTRLGQSALVAAGASPAWAAKQRGGLFNLETPMGRVQVIFNSNEGGNHFNHLHVGLKPRGMVV